MRRDFNLSWRRPSPALSAALVALSGTLASAQQVLFDAGPPETCMDNGGQQIALVGLSSGSLASTGAAQRWLASPFTLARAATITEIAVDGFDGAAPETNPAGNLTFGTLNYIIWRRTGFGAPVAADQAASGSVSTAALGQGVVDPRSQFQNLMKFRITLSMSLALPAGSYYFTVYASDPSPPGADANFAWFINAQPDPSLTPVNTPISMSDGNGVFTWRSSAFPAPGFVRYTTAQLSVDPAPAQGPSPQSPQYLYNASFTVIGTPAPCYANCDGSTNAPILNVNDFICFQNRFAAGDSYANCDGSTNVPILNVNDFICFQNMFAAGCP